MIDIEQFLLKLFENIAEVWFFEPQCSKVDVMLGGVHDGRSLWLGKHKRRAGLAGVDRRIFGFSIGEILSPINFELSLSFFISSRG